ncbi:MAG TPA: NAD(P)/FAD-dependent oxidoreductase, partial [Acidimicrobiia bacterium]|nr:NAD(P)/FAD-dependent oxidoreductase [Acidimicrobiia bacterium]
PGSSAALVLGRARARVVLVDAGHPSNAPSTGIGGLLGHDGTAPADFYAATADELAGYPSIERRSATVEAIQPHADPKWRLELDDGETIHTDRILLATGMRYARPEIDGLEPRWGASVFHCPFCHGWEHRDQPLAVLGGPPERALLLRRWTDDLTLISNGATFTDEEREQLSGAGIRIVDGRIAAVAGPGRGLKSIVLTDGTTVDVTGLLVPAPHEIRRPSLLEGLGLDFTPTGHIATDGFGATSIDGIWAAGDLASPMSNVARAIAAGSDSAVAITRHLVANTGYRPSGKEAAPSNR